MARSNGGQTVAEFGLGLTISALRRITANLRGDDGEPRDLAIQTEGWQTPAKGAPSLATDPRFVSGTIAGKRVRVVGIGNIGGRYASWCSNMGADVAVWDPFAPEASFTLAGVRRCFDLSELVKRCRYFCTDGTPEG